MKMQKIGLASAIALGALFAATGQALAGSLIPTRTDLDTALGGSGKTEDFEKYNIGNGNATALNISSLDSSTVVDGQGPGLVVDGVSFTGGIQWNGQDYYGAPSREILANSQPFVIDFSDIVDTFGLDLRAFTEYGDTAAVKIFAADDVTVLDTISSIDLSASGVPVFFGYKDLASGIGKVELTQSTYSWSPIIDNLSFGKSVASTSVPEPGSMFSLLAFGALGATSMLKGKQQKKAIAKT